MPARRTEERLEEIARELMTVTAMLRSAELRTDVCPADTIERAKLALAATTPEGRKALWSVCEPARLRLSLVGLCLSEHLSTPFLLRRSVQRAQ